MHILIDIYLYTRPYTLFPRKLRIILLTWLKKITENDRFKIAMNFYNHIRPSRNTAFKILSNIIRIFEFWKFGSTLLLLKKFRGHSKMMHALIFA